MSVSKLKGPTARSGQRPLGAPNAGRTPQEFGFWRARLFRGKRLDGATGWTLAMSSDEVTKYLAVTVGRTTTWAGPCSNEVAYRCVVQRDDTIAAAIEAGMEDIVVEGRGPFNIRAIVHGADNSIQFDLHRGA